MVHKSSDNRHLSSETNDILSSEGKKRESFITMILKRDQNIFVQKVFLGTLPKIVITNGSKKKQMVHHRN